MNTPNKVIIDLDNDYLLVSSISTGGTLGLLASRQANFGNLASRWSCSPTAPARCCPPS
jgi:hypothetical protein